ncbi:MAG: hypothetical protein M3R67_14020, partial [Acidobacteriota bacterium]|nr:hypothetical protein [Acidobacteriota bacterium]
GSQRVQASRECHAPAGRLTSGANEGDSTETEHAIPDHRFARESGAPFPALELPSDKPVGGILTSYLKPLPGSTQSTEDVRDEPRHSCDKSRYILCTYLRMIYQRPVFQSNIDVRIWPRLCKNAIFL